MYSAALESQAYFYVFRKIYLSGRLIRQERVPAGAVSGVVRNPFLPEHQASQGRQERIPDDALAIP
jgi:hypothetical protein